MSSNLLIYGWWNVAWGMTSSEQQNKKMPKVQLDQSSTNPSTISAKLIKEVKLGKQLLPVTLVLQTVGLYYVARPQAPMGPR